MSVKTDPASAEIPSAEVFVPAAILDPDFPGLRAAPGQPLSCVQSVLSGQPDPSGSSVPCAQSVPCDQSVPGDISVASGQPVTPGLAAVSVRPVSPAQGAIAGRPAVSGYGAVCTDGAGPSGALPSVAGVPPSFGAFALAVYPFLELQPFHRAYYRVLEAFAGRAHPASDRHHASPARQERRRDDTASGLRAGARSRPARCDRLLFRRRWLRNSTAACSASSNRANMPRFFPPRPSNRVRNRPVISVRSTKWRSSAAAADCSPSGAKARSRVTVSTASSSTTSTRMPSKPIRPSSAPIAGSGIPRSCGRACTTPRAN